MQTKTSNISKLIPVMFTFFCMGFVDMVGTATNFIKSDFDLSDTMANFLPSMVFLWFFILSVPTSLLMNRIGRKNIVLISLFVTVLALAVPMLGYNYPMMIISFCLLGIGNTFMQVSLNPLISCIVKGDILASTLTFGQFVKAIASFIAPIIASWAAVKFGDWRILYIIFLVICILATIYLWATKVEEEKISEESSDFFTCIKMLGKPAVLLLFLGIVAHVGIDVGINTCAPKIFIERLGVKIEDAAIATSVYFLFRTLGCFTGTFILAKWADKKFFALSVACMVISMVGLFFLQNKIGLYIAIGLVGFGNSNIFPMIFSRALLYNPDKKNEMSGLMIMGLIGGTIFPMIMGVLSDALNSQIGSVITISCGVLYLIFLSYSFFKKNQ